MIDVDVFMFCFCCCYCWWFRPTWPLLVSSLKGTVSLLLPLLLSFLDALASLKTMFKIKWVADVFKISRLKSIRGYYRVLQSVTEYNRVLQSVTECYRVLQSFTECYRVLQSVTECYRVLQSVTDCYWVFLAHLLGPILGLVIYNHQHLSIIPTERRVQECTKSSALSSASSGASGLVL